MPMMTPSEYRRFAWYRFTGWLYRWTLDEDNAITFTVAGCLNFTKYKESTIVKFGRNWKSAPKHVEIPVPA